VWHNPDADDHDWCFSPVSAWDPHAQCRDLSEKELGIRIENQVRLVMFLEDILICESDESDDDDLKEDDDKIEFSDGESF
jgi:hypothetical protein